MAFVVVCVVVVAVEPVPVTVLPPLVMVTNKYVNLNEKC